MANIPIKTLERVFDAAEDILRDINACKPFGITPKETEDLIENLEMASHSIAENLDLIKRQVASVKIEREKGGLQ